LKFILEIFRKRLPVDLGSLDLLKIEIENNKIY